MPSEMLKQVTGRGGIPHHRQEDSRNAKGEFGYRGLLLPDVTDSRNNYRITAGIHIAAALDQPPQLLTGAPRVVA